MTGYMGTFDESLGDEAHAMSVQRAQSMLSGQACTRRRFSPWVLRYVAMTAGADALVAMLGTVICFLGRFGDNDTAHLSFAAMVCVAPVVWVGSLWALKAYDRNRFGVGTEEYRSVTAAAVLVFALIAVVSYVFKAELARGFVMAVVPMVLALSLLVHCVARVLLDRSRAAGDSMLSTVVVGRADSVATMIREINDNPRAGFHVVGACASGLDSSWNRDVEMIEGVPVVGAPEQAVIAADRLGAEVVAVSSHPDLVGHSLRRLSWALAERQVELVVAPGILEVAGPRLSLRPAAGLSLLHVERPASGGLRAVLKRLMDLVLTTGLLVALSPVFLAIAAAIKLTSRGPIFYVQERVGAAGELFRMIKFRSMVVDADAKITEVDQGQSVNAILFKDRNDPRVTGVGKWLRRLSLDELPQLVNVLVGDMSLVGPRPPLPREVAQYPLDAVQRLRVRPGMTGLWQISGRSDLEWEQALRLDLWYVDNWSPVLDLQILIRTFRAVFGASGAY